MNMRYPRWLHRIAVLIATAVTGACLWAAEPVWQVTAPGLTVRTVHPLPDVTVIAVRADATCRIRVVDAHHGAQGVGRWAADVCPANGAAINASYFTRELAPLGLLIIDGRQTQPPRGKPFWATFMIRHGKPALALTQDISLRGVTQAVECQPRLVVGRQIQHFKQQPATARSAVGLDAAGRAIFAATANGLTLEQWAACLRDDLGCIDALNFDGGPSTQLAVRGKIALSIPGGWEVPIFITVSPGR